MQKMYIFRLLSVEIHFKVKIIFLQKQRKILQKYEI